MARYRLMYGGSEESTQGFHANLQATRVRTKSAWIAVLLTFLFLGLGQAYVGYWGRGFMALALGVVFAVLISIGIGLIMLPLWYILVAYDAYTSAEEVAACSNCTGITSTRAVLCGHCGSSFIN